MTTKKELMKEIKIGSESFCNEFLSKDYYKVVNRLINNLDKNKKFSMDKGKKLGWIAGLIYVVGEDSGLFDKNNFYKGKIYISKSELSRHINISVSTMKSREKEIRKALPKNAKFIASIKDEFSYFNKDGSFNQKAMDKNIENLLNSITTHKEVDYENICYTKLVLNTTKKFLKNNIDSLTGSFFIKKDNRKYILMKQELAELYVKEKDYESAIIEYEDIINLKSKYDKSIRNKLLSLFLISNKNEKFEKFASTYIEESAFLLYTKALYYYKENQIFNAKLNLRKAFKTNEFIPKYLIGMEVITELPQAYNDGSKEEAMIYFDENIDLWLSVENSLIWLVNNYFDYARKNNIKLKYTKDETTDILNEAIEVLREMNLFKV
ncbi:MAG: DUF6398 domain-containing protein [Romboutsia sp.]